MDGFFAGLMEGEEAKKGAINHQGAGAGRDEVPDFFHQLQGFFDSIGGPMKPSNMALCSIGVSWHPPWRPVVAIAWILHASAAAVHASS